MTALLAGCTVGGADPERSAPAAGSDAGGSPSAAAADPELEATCTAFWGDPDYTAPLSRVVLDRAATAPEAGPSDPFFYSMTGDDIETAFERAPEDVRARASTLADWFRTEPEQGQEADRDGFRDAWGSLADGCQDVSAAALWAADAGGEGTKPAPLVCADVFDTPGTLTHFANANVLTSNMFKLVGRTAQQVPADRGEDVQATADLLAAEIAAVDDEAVRAALEQVRAPFQDALDGETWSEGLQDPLTELGAACEAAGYAETASGEPGTEDQDGEEGSDEEDGTLVGSASLPDPDHRAADHRTADHRDAAHPDHPADPDHRGRS